MEPFAIILGLTILGLSYGFASYNAIRKETTMANNVQQEAEVKVLISDEQVEELLGKNPIVIGNTSVYGIELISSRFISIINHLLTREEWGVQHLIFDTNLPEDKYGMYSSARNLVVINLGQHWESAVKLIKHDEHYLSIRGHLWHNMLMSLLHELVHSKGKMTGEAEYDAMTVEAKDEMAEEVAQELIEELAKAFDIEPSPMAEEPFFGTRYMQLYIDTISDCNDTWAVRQNEMHDEKHIYLDESGNVLIETFRDYIRGIFDGKRTDKSWEIEVNSLPLFAPPVVIVQPADEQPKVIVVDKEGAATVVPATQPAPKTVSKLPADEDGLSEPVFSSTVEVGGWEDEALAHLLGEQGCTPQVEPSFNTMGSGAPNPMTTAAAPITAAPAAPAALATFCTNCGNQTAAGAMFCGSCGKPITTAAAPAVAPATGAPATTDPASEPPWYTDHGNAKMVEPEPQNAWQVAHNQPKQTYMQSRRIEKLDTNLPRHNLTGEQMSAILSEVYMRLYNFCFDKCGWQMPLPTAVLYDQTGTLCRDGFNRDTRQAVLGGIVIADIPGATQFIYCYRAHDVNGQLRKIMADGRLRGWITKDARIPMFNLYLNAGQGGEAQKRVFIPQNPYKVKNGSYTNTALAAQAGAKIAYIFNGDDRVQDGDPNKYKGDIKDGFLNLK